MNAKLLSILLFVIPYCIICDGEATCDSLFNSIAQRNSIFNIYKENQCINLTPSSSKSKCIYTTEGCTSNYIKCSDYTVGTGETFSDTTCQNIKPENSKKKCIAQNNQCKEVFKVCTDYDGKDECSSLKINTEGTDESTKRCALNENRVCGVHYKECTTIQNNDNNLCDNNIPTDEKKKCVWDSTGCKSQDRKCSDYTVINAYLGSTTCSSLAHATEKKCILNGITKQCEEKPSCEDYKGSTPSECNNNTPIDKNKDNLDISNLYKCAFDPNREEDMCFQTLKLCEDYEAGYNNCKDLHTYDLNKKRCFLDGTCKEVYIGCGLGTEGNCTGTIPYKIDENNEIVQDIHFKCEWSGTSCQLKERECNDDLIVNDQTLCLAHTFTDSNKSNKKCIYDSTSKCKEVYKTCELYEQNENTKTQNGCEEIYPTYEPKKCIFTEATTTPVVPAKCQTKERECEEGKNSVVTCEAIKASNSTHYCRWSGSSCEEHYRNCKTTSDRLECEKNIPYDKNKECILVHDSRCELATKQNQEQVYHYCSDYKESDANICGSIIPLTESGEPYSYSVKCKIKENKCVLAEPKCDGINNELQCFATILKDPNKICVYDNDITKENKCIEQYKDCSTFEANKNEVEESKRKDMCEGLIGQKCSYTSNTCTAIPVECDHFNENLLSESPCTILTNSITDKANKCVYDVKNGKCLDVPKTCSELGTFPNGVESDEKESICKRAEVREADKKCIVKEDGTGCKLVDNSQNPGQSDQTNPGQTGESSVSSSSKDNSESDKPNSARGQYLSKIVIIILCLLF